MTLFFFESHEAFIPSVEMKILPSIASNAGHHIITLFGKNFELLPSVSIANIPATCWLALHVICKVPRSSFVGQTHFSVSLFNLSLPFVYTPTLVVESLKIESYLLFVNGQFGSCIDAQLVVGNIDIAGNLFDNVMTFVFAPEKTGNFSVRVECNHKMLASSTFDIEAKSFGRVLSLSPSIFPGVEGMTVSAVLSDVLRPLSCAFGRLLVQVKSYDKFYFDLPCSCITRWEIGFLGFAFSWLDPS